VIPDPGAPEIPMQRFDDILECDTLVDNMCLECGTHGALFATPRMFSACPRCLADRIRRLREMEVDLPEWLLYLEKAGEREAVRQHKAEEAKLSVSFDDFYHCARCDRLIQAQDARYYLPPGATSSPAYCVGCYEELRRG
jgi:hypothetical protein